MTDDIDAVIKRVREAPLEYGNSLYLRADARDAIAARAPRLDNPSNP